jgi:hypothetical protein
VISIITSYFVELKCGILDQETHETIPKCLDNLSDVNMTSSRKRNYNDEEHDDDNEEIRNVGRRLPRIESDEHEESNASNENNSLAPALSNSLNLSEKQDLKEMSVDEIIKLAKNKEFPKKLFIFDRAKVFYTPRLHFWTSKRIFVNKFRKFMVRKRVYGHWDDGNAWKPYIRKCQKSSGIINKSLQLQ